MKRLKRACLIAALMALPVAASAQNDTAAKAEAPKAAAPAMMMMNCPMMAGMGDMQKDFGAMMGDLEGMMKGTKEADTKERLQKMHERMAVMMARMQTMQSMMGGGMPGAAQPNNTAPAAPATPPASEDEHNAHHPAP
jgi:hypothetical protein